LQLHLPPPIDYFCSRLLQNLMHHHSWYVLKGWKESTLQYHVVAWISQAIHSECWSSIFFSLFQNDDIQV
jgi:hypothetical protein